MKLLRFIWNPFETQRSQTLTIVGIGCTIIGLLLSIFFETIQDGVLDLHLASVSAMTHLGAILLNLAVLTLTLFACGQIINRKTRWIDILNAVLVARIWIYLSIPLVGNSFMKEVADDIMEQALHFDPSTFPMADMALMLVLSLSALLFLLYFLIFLYNGFRVAAHARHWKHIFYYMFTILIAEIISKVLFFYLF